MAALEQIARGNAAAFERLERRIDGLERRMDGLERRMDGLERRIDTLVSDQRTDFRWMVGIMLGGFGVMLGAVGAVLGVMAHGFHWL